MIDTNEKPCLVDCAGQGFSVFKSIDYKGRLLYSKYNPVRSINSIIQNMQILSGTLVFIFSPGLWYGLDELKKILPQNCTVVAVEADKKLFEVSKEHNSTKELFFRFSTQDDIGELDNYLKKICQSGKIRRAIRIDFCAGVQFFPEQYNAILNATTLLISTFWKNRVTLGKMGKLYAKNIFRNLIKTAHNNWIEYFEKTVNKPLLVCGAGESLDDFDWSCVNEKYFVIASDAALMPLKKRGIKIDAIVCLESQIAIEKMFIGCSDDTPLFMDIASRSALTRLYKNIIWFSTKYSSNSLLDNLYNQGIIKNFINPNGSVGLTAIELALRLRTSSSVPVFVVGLDFSYSTGFTHARGTNPHIMRIVRGERLNSVANYDASFGENVFKAAGKNNNPVWTTPVLSSYAKAFIDNFSREKNIFDAGKTGLKLNIPQKVIECTNAIIWEKSKTCEKQNNSTRKTKIIEFYHSQKSALLTTLDLLSNGESSQQRNDESLSDQITNLLKDKDYLWLHFPDGTQFNLSTSFLKRIKAEIHFFIKQIDTALNNPE